MKWIGQHIWDFVSRFRSKVYLEDVATDNSITDVLVVDPNTYELKKKTDFSGGSGTGGSVTVKATEASGGEAFTSINTIQVYDATTDGTGIQAYDDGTGKVLISVPPANFSSPFGISSTPNSTFSTNKRIATSSTGASRKFYAGDWNGAAASSTKYLTTSNALVFDSVSQRGNMENSSKIEVRIYGPQNNVSTNTGASTQIGTATHVYNGNSTGSFNSDGIKIDVLNEADDIVPNKKKARIKVTFNPATIPAALVNGDHDFSGSQKYHSVKIYHTSNDGNTTYGTFESVSFFYDHQQVTPGTPSNFSTSQNTSGTIHLSNIKYFDDTTWNVTGSNIANLARDTRDSTDLTTTISPSTISTSSNGQKNFDVSDHDGTTTDDVNTLSTTYTLANDNYYFNLNVGCDLTIKGGMASNNTATSSQDARRNYNSYALTTQANTTDNFRSESHRLGHHNVGTWNSSSISQATLETYAGPSNLTNDGKNLLIQTQHSGSTFKLVHPTNLPSVGSSPTQDRFIGSTPSSTDYVYYYRYFELPSAGGSLTFRMYNISRTEYQTAYGQNTLQVHFSRPTNGPGNNTTWIPLNMNKFFDTNDPTVTCFDGNQPTSNALFNIQFDTNPITVVVRIKMKGNFTTTSTTMTGLSLTNGHS